MILKFTKTKCWKEFHGDAKDFHDGDSHYVDDKLAKYWLKNYDCFTEVKNGKTITKAVKPEKNKALTGGKNK